MIYAVIEKQFVWCISKKFCITYTTKKGKYANYKELSPKYISNSKFIILILYNIINN